MIGFLRGIIISILSSVGILSYGQDIIKPKNGEELQVKIIGFANHKVEFKSFYSPKGPSVFLSNKQIDYIKYADGTILDSAGFANKDKSESTALSAVSKPPAPVGNSATNNPLTAPVDATLDSDHDGVPDINDKCPRLKGPKQHHGCPDTDGDLVFDDEDRCIDLPGPAENHGCPLSAEIDSTADADEDGIPDYLDRCPYQKGEKMFEGCPKPKHTVAEFNDYTYADIEFDEKQATLLLPATMLLDQFIKSKAEELKNTAGYEWLLIIKAYADVNEGETAGEKEVLSKQRFLVVYNYLVSHGIPLQIIIGDYVGDTELLAPSDTETHRKKNRVVELIQRFKK